MSNVYRDQFMTIKDQVMELDLFQAMKDTVENSPWHREANVFVHTENVVAAYVARADAAYGNEWPIAALHGAIAALFHDVGKPKAEEVKFREDRGEYRSYHGHELLSARLFEDMVCELDLWKGLHVYAVLVMIEHHIAYDYKQDKLRNLLITLRSAGGQELVDAFVNLVYADQEGRISDDSESKLVRLNQWVDQLKKLNDQLVPATKPVNAEHPVYLMVGASGSGKTSCSIVWNNVHSMDSLRLDWYGNEQRDNYAEAFAAACQDLKFSAKVLQHFTNMVRSSDGSVIVDNTNTTKKSRAVYVRVAKDNGRPVVGVVFHNSIKTLLERRISRTDKTIPEDAVLRQYMLTSVPLLGEVDEVWSTVCNSAPNTHFIHQLYQ